MTVVGASLAHVEPVEARRFPTLPGGGRAEPKRVLSQAVAKLHFDAPAGALIAQHSVTYKKIIEQVPLPVENYEARAACAAVLPVRIANTGTRPPSAASAASAASICCGRSASTTMCSTCAT